MCSAAVAATAAAAAAASRRPNVHPLVRAATMLGGIVFEPPAPFCPPAIGHCCQAGAHDSFCSRILHPGTGHRPTSHHPCEQPRRCSDASTCLDPPTLPRDKSPNTCLPTRRVTSHALQLASSQCAFLLLLFACIHTHSCLLHCATADQPRCKQHASMQRAHVRACTHRAPGGVAVSLAAPLHCSRPCPRL
jgi:hypothetical protein